MPPGAEARSRLSRARLVGHGRAKPAPAWELGTEHPGFGGRRAFRVHRISPLTRGGRGMLEAPYYERRACGEGAAGAPDANPSMLVESMDIITISRALSEGVPQRYRRSFRRVAGTVSRRSMIIDIA